MREILTDPKIMKTTTLLAGNIPSTEDELNEIIKSFMEPNENLREKYGLQKIYKQNSDECLGVAGLIRTNSEVIDELIISEAVLLIKSQYIGKGMGLFASIKLIDMAMNLNNILISSVWEENTPSIRLIEKNGMKLKERMVKTYKNLSFIVRTYIKFPKTIIEADNAIDIKSLLLTKKLSTRIEFNDVQKVA